VSPQNSSAPPAEIAKALAALVPPSDLVIPVEEWDWDEIRRLEDVVRVRYSRFPRCEKCNALMVLGQSRLHHSCRPPAPLPPRKLKAKGR
jgi:hypothetical protein